MHWPFDLRRQLQTYFKLQSKMQRR